MFSLDVIADIRRVNLVWEQAKCQLLPDKIIDLALYHKVLGYFMIYFYELSLQRLR